MTLTVAFISLLFSNCCFVRLFLSWLLKSSPLSISYFCILQLCLPCVSIWLCFYLSCLEFMFLESNHYYYLLSLENYLLFLTFPLFSLVSLKLVFDVWWDCQIFCSILNLAFISSISLSLWVTFRLVFVTAFHITNFFFNCA